MSHGSLIRSGVAASLLLAVGSVPATTQEAATNTSCAPHDQIVKMLGQQFREEPKAVGLIDQKTILEVFTSPAGTWTIVATDTEGVSCVLAAGEGWDDSFTQTISSEGA